MIDFDTYSPLLKAHRETAFPKDGFYHYTSPDALIGILKNKELWASHTLFLNDAMEVKHGIQVAQELIAQRLISEEDGVAHTFLEIMQDALKFPTPFKKQAYVISFTELGDALSQWRGYCPASGGYAVGLPPAQVSNMAHEQGFVLVKCIYGVDLQRAILNEVISTAVIAYQKNVEEGDAPDSITVNSDAFFDYIQIVCSLMKNVSFDEEHEWRLILLSDESSDQKLFFRSSYKGVIPYFKFNLLSDTHPSLVEAEGVKFVVRVGPSANKEERVVAVNMILKQCLSIDAESIYSNVPYQTW